MSVSILKRSATTAIPTYGIDVDRKRLKISHPTILFLVPQSFHIKSFTTNLLSLIRRRYYNCIVSKSKVICTFNNSNLEVSFEYQNNLYFNNHHTKMFLAIDMNIINNDHSENIIDTLTNDISAIINDLTSKIVYQNKPGRLHPNFDSLIQRRTILFENTI